jgi:hypothetical protein
VQVEDEGLALVVSSFFPFHSSINLRSNSLVLFGGRINHVLNIIERRRWVRAYLRHYLKLGEDDRRGVLENSPSSHHLTMLKEELLKIGMARFKRLVTLLRQGVKGGLEDVALVEVRSVVAGVSPLHA